MIENIDNWRPWIWEKSTQLNLVKQKNYDNFNIIDQIYLNVNKTQTKMNQNINILFKIMKKRDLDLHKNPKTFNEFSNNMQDVYKTLKNTN